MRGVVESCLQLEPHPHLIILSFLEMAGNNRHGGEVGVEPKIRGLAGQSGGKQLWCFGGRCGSEDIVDDGHRFDVRLRIWLGDYDCYCYCIYDVNRYDRYGALSVWLKHGSWEIHIIRVYHGTYRTYKPDY